MKWCTNCNAAFEDEYYRCPACGSRLESIDGEPFEEPGPTIYPDPELIQRRSNNNQPQFLETVGSRVIVNGEIADLTTQQLYQSKFTKMVRAIFSGEPYQLSHTSFITVVRVEEHVNRGFPEQALDFTLFGSMQSLLSPGDDVRVTAKRTGHRYIAKQIYNHTTNSQVRVSPNISATVIRVLSALLLLVVVTTVVLIASIDYSAIGSAIKAAVFSILPTVIMVVAIVYYIFSSIRKK